MNVFLDKNTAEQLLGKLINLWQMCLFPIGTEFPWVWAPVVGVYCGDLEQHSPTQMLKAMNRRERACP